MSEKVKCLSLFAGIGGFEVGMAPCGFTFTNTLEWDENCCTTLNANRQFTGAEEETILPIDIMKMDAADFSSEKVDYIVGGPPCQSFSAAGRRAGGVAGTSDTRGTLFWYYCQYVKHFKPKAFVFENVRGILSSKKGEDFKIICASFEEVGYNLYWRILNAADFGVPQQRERVFLVGIRKEYYPEALKVMPRGKAPVCVDPVTLAHRLGLSITTQRIREDSSVFGQLYFVDTDALLFDSASGSEKTVRVDGRTIVVDPMNFLLRNFGSVNNTIIHECVHWVKHRKVFELEKLYNEDTAFIDYFDEYEKLISSLVERLGGSDEDVVFATIALFTLEWKYNVELFYSCAVQAEKNSTDDIPLNRISRLCTELSMPLLPYCTQTLRTESRFILHRKKLIPNVYESSDDEWLVINNKLYQYFCAKYHIKNGIVRKWDMAGFFARYTSTEQWASFFREHYNLRDFNQKREWTPKRIRYVRKLYQELYLDIEPPKL